VIAGDFSVVASCLFGDMAGHPSKVSDMVLW
jgi:hypothetical protein